MYVRTYAHWTEVGRRTLAHGGGMDHAWASELLKLDYELLFQTGLLWLAKLSLHTRHFGMV